MATYTSSEGKTENVQLSTPQFHLGPVEGPDFCESDAEFDTGEATWAADYVIDWNTSTSKVVSTNVCNMKSDSKEFEHDLEVCKEDGEPVSKVQETQSVGNLDRELSLRSNIEDEPASGEREDIFQSCLELQELARQEENGGREVDVEDSEVESPQTLTAAGDSDNRVVGVSRSSDKLSPSNSEHPSSTSPDFQVELEPNETNAQGTDQNVPNGAIVHSDSDDQEPEGLIGVAGSAEVTHGSLQETASRDECTISTAEECQTSLSDTGKRLEISLCGNLLRAGMGLSVATEAFDNHLISEEDFKLSAASIIKNESLVVRFQDRYLTRDNAAPIVLGMAAFGLDFPVESYDAIPVEQDETPKLGEESGIMTTPSGHRWRLWPIPFRRVKTLEHNNSNESSEDVTVSFHATC